MKISLWAAVASLAIIASQSIAAPVGCFEQCFKGKGVTPRELALGHHKPLMQSARDEVLTAGNLKKQALEKAIDLRKQCVYITHCAQMPLDHDYNDFVNNQIKFYYPEKLDAVVRQLGAHITDLEGHKKKTTEAEAMIERVQAAKNWLQNLPDDRASETTFILHDLEKQKDSLEKEMKQL